MKLFATTHVSFSLCSYSNNLDGEASTFSNLQGILKSAGTSTVAWVGEAGGAYNSGHHLVTDAFVFSFW